MHELNLQKEANYRTYRSVAKRQGIWDRLSTSPKNRIRARTLFPHEAVLGNVTRLVQEYLVPSSSKAVIMRIFLLLKIHIYQPVLELTNYSELRVKLSPLPADNSQEQRSAISYHIILLFIILIM